MKVLIVKTSSMGDLIHTLPALTDACRENPGIRFDWVAERAFTEIASWHSAVERVIPIDLRSWKHRPFSRQTLREIVVALKGLQFQRYDWIIDAQGLVKSALVTGLAHGRSAGMSWTSCKEGLASLAYRKRFVILKEAHAIDRLRELFAKVLNYRYDAARLDYGWTQREWVDAGIEKPYLVFLHASSKERKCWHNAEWVDAARLAQHAGYRVVLPQGNLTERVQAQALASLCSNIQVLPCMNLNGLAGLLSQAAGVIGIDTGLAHLAAALGTPATTLYFTSSPRLAGARGECQLSLTASQGSESGECLDTSMGGAPLRFLNKLDAASVWECLLEQIASARTNPDV